MFSKMRAIHVAVEDLEAAVKQYKEGLGLQPSEMGTLEVLGIRNALFPVGDGIIELIEPLDHEHGPVSKFLKTRGEGVYMMALEVEDLEAAVRTLKERGVRLLSDDEASRARGIPVFIHPKSTRGVLVELVEKKS